MSLLNLMFCASEDAINSKMVIPKLKVIQNINFQTKSFIKQEHKYPKRSKASIENEN